MKVDSLLAVSPIDGRYIAKTSLLQPYFSELALVRYRLKIEVEYFLALLKFLRKSIPAKEKKSLRRLYENFSLKDAKQVKKIEQETRHDVKAMEYFLKDNLSLNLQQYKELVHFGLTSCDINDNAYSLMLHAALREIYLPLLGQVLAQLQTLAEEYRSLPMLARTHGQPASPTTVGKEFNNFAVRLQGRIEKLRQIKLPGKLTGATGNFNALVFAFPRKDWILFSKVFIDSLGLNPKIVTTQIQPREEVGDLLSILTTVNNVLLDLCRDMWLYISYDYFNVRAKKCQVGSSTMPHKVNPIDFENGEGNLELANALLLAISNKIQVSRLQRDLSDSTVLRNLGAGFAYSIIAYKSIMQGLQSIDIDPEQIKEDLNSNWSILGEALQTVLRKEQKTGAFEKVAKRLRGRKLNKDEWIKLVGSLDLTASSRAELLRLTPESYLGYAERLALEKELR